MTEHEEKGTEKKTEKKAASPRKKKAAPAEGQVPAEQAAVTPAEGAVPAKKKAVRAPRKKTAETAAPETAGAAPETAKEKPAKKPRAVKVKKEALAPAAPEAPAHAAHAKPHAEEKPAHPKPEKKAEAHPKAHVPAHPAVPVAPAVHKPAPAPVKAPAPAPQPAAPAAAAAPVAPAAPAAPAKPAPAVPSKGSIKINELTTVRDLADKMNVKIGDLLKKMLGMGSMMTINQRLDVDTATLIAQEFGYAAVFASLYAEEKIEKITDQPEKLKARAPVVTIMGHVDHGKTSLLDAIRESRVAEGEAGGITQHIGAYRVHTAKGDIAFLDTPGHEAFTAMRSRGAQATDLVVLVVSAADGVMPQTVEAIDHARAAGVPIIVAINKVDLPTANPNQVKQELNKYNLIPEDWGGDIIMVEVSAKKKINIDALLEMILLKAEMMELKANPDRLAQGVVIEARLDPRRGPVATVLVQAGTLRVGDNFVVGTTYGKIRAMTDEYGKRLNEALPSTPVEILGINAPPQAGDHFVAVEQEYQARQVAQSRTDKAREDSLRPRHHLSLEDISAGKAKELRLVLKADVQGSLEALSDSLERLSTSDVALRIIHRGAGGITESDVTLAAASDAVIIGFTVRPESAAERLADEEGVSIRVYRIIYEVIDDVKKAMEGLLEPSIKETMMGKAQVKQVFKISKVGMIAGSMVTDGRIQRNNKIRLVRDNVIVYEGAVSSLFRFKDDVKEVEKGFECGIGLENFSDMKVGDIIEAFVQEKVARKL